MAVRVERVRFNHETHVAELSKFNSGVKPRYGRGTMRGVAWCSCGCCVGDVVLLSNNNVLGWIDPVCYCGNQIDWSDAKEFIYICKGVRNEF